MQTNAAASEDDWRQRRLPADKIPWRRSPCGKRPFHRKKGKSGLFLQQHFKWLVDLFPVVPRNPAAGSQEDVGDREQGLHE